MLRPLQCFQHDIPSENLRLKANNVKKVLNAIIEYYAEVLNLRIAEFPAPDVTKVAEGHSKDTGKQSLSPLILA